MIAELREEVQALRREVRELREGRGGPDRPRPDGPPREGDRPRPDGERRPEGDRPRPDAPRRETAETDRAVEIEIELKRN